MDSSSLTKTLLGFRGSQGANVAGIRVVSGALGFVFGALAFAQIACAANFQVVHRFKGGRDGGDPAAALRADQSGNLFGTTSQQPGGGPGKYCAKTCGNSYALFQGGQFQSFYSFRGGDRGEFPTSPLLIGNDGNFYGVATGGPAGIIYKLTPGGQQTVLYTFSRGGYPCVDGAFPNGPLLTDG